MEFLIVDEVLNDWSDCWWFLMTIEESDLLVTILDLLIRWFNEVSFFVDSGLNKWFCARESPQHAHTELWSLPRCCCCVTGRCCWQLVKLETELEAADRGTGAVGEREPVALWASFLVSGGERCAVWRGWRQSAAFQEPRGDSVYRARSLRHWRGRLPKGEKGRLSERVTRDWTLVRERESERWRLDWPEAGGNGKKIVEEEEKEGDFVFAMLCLRPQPPQELRTLVNARV